MLLPLVLLATCVAAELSFRFVERPAMRRLRDQAGRASVAAAHAPPAAPTAAGRGGPSRGAGSRGCGKGRAGATWPRPTPLRGLAVLAVVAFHITAGALFVTGYLTGSRAARCRPETAFGPVIGARPQRAPGRRLPLLRAVGLPDRSPVRRGLRVGRPRCPSLRSYARNRVLRIFPAAWLLIALLLFKYGDRGAEHRRAALDDHAHGVVHAASARVARGPAVVAEGRALVLPAGPGRLGGALAAQGSRPEGRAARRWSTRSRPPERA